MTETTTAPETTPAETLAAACAALGLTMRAQFVPFSQSRNAKPRNGADKPWRSLNWVVTLERNGRDVLTTDYSQGDGHAPSYKLPAIPRGWKENAIAHECETGMVHRVGEGMAFAADGTRNTRVPIAPPSLADVVHSMISDSDVLDYGRFEDWADAMGYESDSRAAEATYRACLEIALQLRSAIGEAGIEALRTAGEDY